MHLWAESAFLLPLVSSNVGHQFLTINLLALMIYCFVLSYFKEVTLAGSKKILVGHNCQLCRAGSTTCALKSCLPSSLVPLSQCLLPLDHQLSRVRFFPTCVTLSIPYHIICNAQNYKQLFFPFHNIPLGSHFLCHTCPLL